MKRSSCLSAVLVGLSVSMASVAFAAPDAAPAKPSIVGQTKGKAKKAKPKAALTDAKAALTDDAAAKKAKPEPPVEQVQAADPPAPAADPAGTPATAPAEPAAPAAPAAEPAPAAAAEPGISIGTPGVPGADSPSASAEDPKKPAKARPWAGSQIFATTSMTTATVFKAQNQYSNPTVDSSIWLMPRFAINEAFQLRALLIYSYEFTNADDTVTKNEPRFSDTTLSLFYRKIPEIPGGIKPAIAVTAGLPTSPESRARTLVVNPGATLQLVKAFEKVLGGEVDLIVSGLYSHPLYRSTTPELRGTAPYAYQCIGGTSCQDQLSGTFNVSDSFGYSLILSGEWGKWSPALFYRGTSQWSYHGSNATNPVDGTTITATPGFGPTHLRQRSYFSAWLDYNANAWFTAELGYWLDRTTLGEDGTRGNIFFDKNQDMRVYLGASFNIDNIMKQLEGGPTEAGIVRAKNTHSPIWHF
jgi:hypothetical protein